ncbi:MAG: sodium transporter, partial [Gammaproteobacteria bacterium]|nr:sodium transporter [Gammaproteobacteria bacterium]
VLLRGLKAVYYGTVINCVVMAFVLIAATRLFEIFLPWHDWLPARGFALVSGWIASTGLVIASGVTGLEESVATTNNVLSIFAMLLFVALYSTTGGLRSVIRTDVMQLAIMLVGTACYAVIAVHAAGGRDEMLDSVVQHYGPSAAERMLSFAPPAGEALMPFVVIISLQWFFQMNSDGTGYLAQRTMACATDRDARLAGTIFTLTQIVVRSLLWLPIAIALLVIFPFDPNAVLTETIISERETVFVRGMDELLPTGFRGLMLTGMLAALASTLDTHLNWGASYWSNDLYKSIWVEHVRKRKASQRELVIVARLSNLVVLSIALAIMVRLGSIQTAWQISLLFGAGTGAVLVLRWLWERVNLYSEIAAIVVSLVVAPILILTVEADWLRLLLMSVISTGVVVMTALFAPPTDAARLEEFYRRVGPPGFWRETARRLTEDVTRPRRELRSGMVAVLSCAISTFGWLVGVGKLMVQPDEAAIAIVMIGVGIAAVPFWVRPLLRE